MEQASTLRALEACLAATEMASISAQPVELFLESLPWEGPGVARLRSIVDAQGIGTLGELCAESALRRRLARRPKAERAFVVDHLRSWMRAELAGIAPAPSLGSQPAPGWGLAAVTDWARRGGLSRCLTTPAHVLEHGLAPGARRWLWSCPPGATVATLFSLPTTAPGLSPAASVPFALKQAAAAWLVDQATLAAAGMAADRPGLPPPEPADSALGPLDQAWRAERSACLGSTPSWPPAAAAAVRYLPEEGTVRWSLSARSCEGDQRELLVDLPVNGGDARLGCGCSAALQATCPRRPQALRAAIRALAGRRHGAQDLRAAVLGGLGQTGWQRSLDQLDQLLARPTPRPDRELGWRLDRDTSGVPRLRPVACRWKPSASAWSLLPLSLDQASRGAAGAPAAADRAVLGELGLLGASSGAAPPGLQRAVVARALSALIGHARVFRGEGAPLPVRRRSLGLVLLASDDGGVQLAPSLDGRPQPLDPLLEKATALSAAGVAALEDLLEDEISVVEASPDALAFFRALAERGDRYPPESLAGLLDRLPAFSTLLPVAVSAELAGRARPPRWRWAVRLRLLGGEALALKVELRVLPVPAGVPRRPGAGPRVVYGHDAGGRVHVERDFDEERRACGELLDTLGLDPAGSAGDAAWTLAGHQRVLGFVHHLERTVGPLPEEEDGIEVRWHGEAVRIVAEAQPEQLAVSVRRGEDWFGLGGGLRVDELEIALGALLDQVRRGSDFIRIRSHDFVRLDARLRERLEALEQGRSAGALGLMGALDDLKIAGAAVEGDEAWQQEEARVRQVLEWTPPLPEGLRATLRPYQVAGFTWLARRAHLDCGAILADDMGLGKTVQTIALLLHCAPEGPALVIAPTSLGPNWEAELARFAPGLRTRAYRGPRRARQLRGLGPGDVVVTSYALAARELAEAGALSAEDFSTLVLDEAQALKNADTQRHRALSQIRRKRAVLLTGTPVENREEDLWSLMTFVRPGVLGTRDAFRTLLAGEPAGAEASPTPEQVRAGRRRLAQRVAPFILRRRKDRVARELPPRTVQTIELVPSPAEAARYRRAQVAAIARLRQTKAAQNDHAARFDVLAALTRLRQLACHPALVDPAWTGPSTKLEHVRSQCLEGVSCGHRILVFSQFTRFLDRVRETLEADGLRPAMLVGSMSQRARQREVERFQRGDTAVFLLSLLAGGTGLNLTEADRVLILDPWWNPAAEAQAADRAHRIGQTRPVHVLRLVTAGTIEARVHRLQDHKRTMVRTVLGSPDSASAEVGSAELRDALVSSLLGRISPDGDGAEDSSALA